MNRLAEIVAARCFAGGAHPFLPRPRSRDDLTGRQGIHTVPAYHKAKYPESDEAHSKDYHEPEQDLPADGITRQATENPEQQSLQPRGQALAKEVPSTGRTHAGKFYLRQNLPEVCRRAA